jgi:ADP-dependent NAD(P)H-hydrate dehydratase / NAD(P)H-hydrate epimerase
MKVAFADQMRMIDQSAQERYEISGSILMERAALSILEVIKSSFDDLSGKRIYICCGKGNNGGDGLALARLLLETKAIVTSILVFEPDQYRGLAGENLKRAEKFGVRQVLWRELNREELTGADLLVDALLGTGSSGVPTGVVAEVIETLNQLGKPVVAVDLPSGIEVDSGRVDGVAIKANRTVTFGLPKPGLLLFPGAEFTGELIVESIGFPRQLLEDEALTVHWMAGPEIRRLLPQRPATAHKGTTGHVLVIGGSTGMTGAVAITSLGALRAGCGLVTAGIRENLSFPEKPVETMMATWPELASRYENFRSIVIGPGLTTREDGKELMLDVIKNARVPLVIDADGLNIIANHPEMMAEFKQPVIFTPHPGEMSRLTGLPVAELQQDRLGIARRFAVEWGVTIVLKGARTIIASPEGLAFINRTGNPGMASAGMGDALAGIIGGLIAQGLATTGAGVAGTYIHGLAGDLAAEKKGMAGLITSDLLQEIPVAIKKVLFDEQV